VSTPRTGQLFLKGESGRTAGPLITVPSGAKRDR